jgi:hypothetical protein
MKKSWVITLIVSWVVLASTAAFAVTDAEMEACFQAHKQLMEKPAVRNMRACWMAHGFLMKHS